MRKLSELSLSDLVALEGIIERKLKSFYCTDGHNIRRLYEDQKIEFAKTKSVLDLIKKEIQTRINELELCLNVY